VNWQDGTIHIEQSVRQGKLQSPKTKTAVRTFELHPSL
jgi:hypothetical protein